MIQAKSPKLKIVRLKAGLFQKDIAGTIGITTNAYTQIENRTRTTTGKTAKKICDCLNVQFDDIFEISELKAGEAHGANANN